MHGFALHRLKEEWETCYPAGRRATGKERTEDESSSPARISPPGVWRIRVTQQQASGAGDTHPSTPTHPPTGSNLLLSSSIMVTPWPQASYLQKINSRGRSHVRLGGGAALPTAALVAELVRGGESQREPARASERRSAGGNRSRSNQTDLTLLFTCICMSGGA